MPVTHPVNSASENARWSQRNLRNTKIRRALISGFHHFPSTCSFPCHEQQASTSGSVRPSNLGPNRITHRATGVLRSSRLAAQRAKRSPLGARNICKGFWTWNFVHLEGSALRSGSSLATTRCGFLALHSLGLPDLFPKSNASGQRWMRFVLLRVLGFERRWNMHEHAKVQ